jgi:hypothetical protein
LQQAFCELTRRTPGHGTMPCRTISFPRCLIANNCQNSSATRKGK